MQTIGGQSDAQSGNQGEGRGREDDQAEDGKMTTEKEGTTWIGRQQTDDNGRH